MRVTINVKQLKLAVMNAARAYLYQKDPGLSVWTNYQCLANRSLRRALKAYQEMAVSDPATQAREIFQTLFFVINPWSDGHVSQNFARMVAHQIFPQAAKSSFSKGDVETAVQSASGGASIFSVTEAGERRASNVYHQATASHGMAMDAGNVDVMRSRLKLLTYVLQEFVQGGSEVFTRSSDGVLIDEISLFRTCIDRKISELEQYTPSAIRYAAVPGGY